MVGKYIKIVNFLSHIQSYTFRKHHSDYRPGSSISWSQDFKLCHLKSFLFILGMCWEYILISTSLYQVYCGNIRKVLICSLRVIRHLKKLCEFTLTKVIFLFLWPLFSKSGYLRKYKNFLLIITVNRTKK